MHPLTGTGNDSSTFIKAWIIPMMTFFTNQGVINAVSASRHTLYIVESLSFNVLVSHRLIAMESILRGKCHGLKIH